MKLLNTLFVVLETSVVNAGFITTIQLNADHVVYKGHFPGHPVTPGVIQMQIVHELLEHQLASSVKLVSMQQCKFLKILNPIETPVVVIHTAFTMVDEVVKVEALGKNGADVFFKLNGIYKQEVE